MQTDIAEADYLCFWDINIKIAFWRSKMQKQLKFRIHFSSSFDKCIYILISSVFNFQEWKPVFLDEKHNNKMFSSP